MKSRNLNQQFKLESLKVEGLKLFYREVHFHYPVYHYGFDTIAPSLQSLSRR